MRERPILFQGAMVRAILAGTKTQTRRVVKPSRGRPIDFHGGGPVGGPDWDDPSCWGYEHHDTATWVMLQNDGADDSAQYPCPYGKPGDRLWVRETWMDLSGTGVEARDPHTLQLTRYAYGADTPAGSYGDQCRKDYGLKWKPSIHMPRTGCRLGLEVTGVRVERLLDISEGDAQAEGIAPCKPCGWHTDEGRHFHALDPRQSYFSLWETINGPGSVDANPWVWAVSFTRIAQPT